MAPSTIVFLFVSYCLCMAAASNLRMLTRHQTPQALQHHHANSSHEFSPATAGDFYGEEVEVPLCTEAMTFDIEDDSVSSGILTLSADELYNHLAGIDPAVVSHVRVLIRGLRCTRGCCEHRLLIRPRGSDPAVLRHALGDYTGFLEKLKPHVNFKAILDAGGNIGVASVVFAHLFPEALIVVLEPQPQNCLVSKANTIALPNVRVQCKGLWDKQTTVGLVPGGDNFDWGWRIQEVPEGTEGAVQTTTVEQLMQEHDLEGFDFVKTDIEGAEFTVFGAETDLSWLKHTQLVAAEVHGWFNEPGLVHDRVISQGFHLSWSGEYAVFARESLHQQLV